MTKQNKKDTEDTIGWLLSKIKNKTEEKREKPKKKPKVEGSGKAWLQGQKQVKDAILEPKLKKMAKKLEEHGFKTKTEKQLERLLSDEELRSEQLQLKTDALTTFLETLSKLDKKEIAKLQILLKGAELRRQVAQGLLGSLAKIDVEEIQKQSYEHLQKDIFDNLYEVVEPSSEQYPKGRRYLTLKGRENEIQWEIRRKKRKGSKKGK